MYVLPYPKLIESRNYLQTFIACSWDFEDSFCQLYFWDIKVTWKYGTSVVQYMIFILSYLDLYSLYHWWTRQLALTSRYYEIAMNPLPCIALGDILLHVWVCLSRVFSYKWWTAVENSSFGYKSSFTLSQ